MQLIEILEFLRAFGVDPSKQQPAKKTKQGSEDDEIDERWDESRDEEIDNREDDRGDKTDEQADKDWHALLKGHVLILPIDHRPLEVASKAKDSIEEDDDRRKNGD